MEVGRYRTNHDEEDKAKVPGSLFTGFEDRRSSEEEVMPRDFKALLLDAGD